MDNTTLTVATCFDSKYAALGLGMLESLFKHATRPVDLYVLALDSAVVLIIRAALPEIADCWDAVEIVREHDILTAGGADLEAAHATHSRREWCWMTGSQITEYAMRKTQEEGEHVVYVDADYHWFRDIREVVDEMRGKSLGFQPHAHLPEEDARLGGNGRYNVGIVGFRADVTGRSAVADWARWCREWCHEGVGDRTRGQYCGDQGYLDRIAVMWASDLAEFRRPGLVTAPWNLRGHAIQPGPMSDGDPLVAYHGHEYRDPSSRSGYALRPEDLAHIYSAFDTSTNKWTAFIEEFNRKGA
jgi:hypothetical protein